MTASRAGGEAPVVAPFAGIPDEGLAFLEDLEERNTREFFEQYKQVFRERLQAPFEALLAAAAARLEAAGVPAGSPKVFRIHRDLRFSTDKTPYKTNMAGYLGRSHADAAGPSTGYYVSFAPSGLWAGGGLHRPARAQLERVRTAVAGDSGGKELAGILDQAAGRGLTAWLDPLQRVPKPFPADHPRAELLRARSLTLGRQHQRGPWMVTVELLDRVVDDWLGVASLNGWIERHLGDAGQG
jgi:uncharacterized protein (TIGR02453 family)